MAYLDGHDPRYEKMNPKRVNYFSTVVTRLSSSTWQFSIETKGGRCNGRYFDVSFFFSLFTITIESEKAERNFERNSLRDRNATPIHFR